MTEFDLIYQKINTQACHRNDVEVGIGDDCAILAVPADHSLAVSIDTLVAGVHFPIDTSAYSIGYKALAVNLSDLAACGATPAWITLSLTMPVSNEQWLTDFIQGVFDLANKFNVQLVGGDTSQGPLSVSIQAHGFVKKALLRSAAKEHDDIYVSGFLGDAALGFENHQNKINLESAATLRFYHPEPRVELSNKLQSLVNACIDISDGLFSDMTHICKQSQCGAIIHFDQLPISGQLKTHAKSKESLIDYLSFGDDYELCFTANKNQRQKIKTIADELGLAITRIGTITNDNKLSVVDENSKQIDINHKGYQHFHE